MKEFFIIPEDISPTTGIEKKINDFLADFKPYEFKKGGKLLLYFDKKSSVYYIICHLDATTLIKNCDLEASLEGNDEDEIYKLNRDITEDKSAFKIMEQDALDGRSFEDMVVEYDKSYKPEMPLKVYSGQHRLKAIEKAKDVSDIVHGVRVYFDLTCEQKVEIATINNTSIAVPNDLLDRMREQLLGSELRDWCQSVGLLEKGKDFADRKSPDMPTVRVARTLLVNFRHGLNAKETDFHQPIVCKSGGSDEDYMEARKSIDWSDSSLKEMGKQFARLHKAQKDTITGREKDNYAEFARKAISLSVVSSWAYAAGFFQRNREHLKTHYAIPDSVSPPNDPLNAKALSEARLKGTDPDTYRGLGARSSSTELGRMLEVFLVLANKAAIKQITITKELANAAIQSYVAKKAACVASKAIGEI